MINQYIQEILYHSVLEDRSLADKWEPSFFDSKIVQTCFYYAKKHLMEYGSAPSKEQMKEILLINEKMEDVTEDALEFLYSAKSHVREYTEEWIHNAAVSWAEYRNFRNALTKTISYFKLKDGEITIENAKEIIETAKGVFRDGTCAVFNDDEGNGSDFWDALSHKQNKLKRRTSGYDFIDHCLGGGYFDGSLICFVGSPKIGKSLWLQNLCAKSMLNGNNNAYISLELPEEMIHSRIGSNIFNIPSMEYFKYTENSDRFRDRIRAFYSDSLVKPGTLIVKSFPTSTLSTIDLEEYLLKKQDEIAAREPGFKFNTIFLDYINIMRNYRNPNSENTYMKIKQIAEDLKAVGLRNGWSIVTATQTNRQQFDSDDMSAKDVAESSALGATVDALFGIIATPMMKSSGEYYLKCIYDRVAPEDNKRKKFLNNIKYLRISEDPTSPIEDVESYTSFMPKIMDRNFGRGKKSVPTSEQQSNGSNETMIKSDEVFNSQTKIISNSDMSSGPIPSSNPEGERQGGRLFDNIFAPSTQF